MKKVVTILAFASSLAAPAFASEEADLRLAQTLVPLLWKCMEGPEEAKVSGATAIIEIDIQDGYLVGEPKVVKQPQTQDERNMLWAAKRAVRLCNPYPSNISLTLRVEFLPNE